MLRFRRKSDIFLCALQIRRNKTIANKPLLPSEESICSIASVLAAAPNHRTTVTRLAQNLSKGTFKEIASCGKGIEGYLRLLPSNVFKVEINPQTKAREIVLLDKTLGAKGLAGNVIPPDIAQIKPPPAAVPHTLPDGQVTVRMPGCLLPLEKVAPEHLALHEKILEQVLPTGVSQEIIHLSKVVTLHAHEKVSNSRDVTRHVDTYNYHFHFRDGYVSRNFPIVFRLSGTHNTIGTVNLVSGLRMTPVHWIPFSALLYAGREYRIRVPKMFDFFAEYPSLFELGMSKGRNRPLIRRAVRLHPEAHGMTEQEAFEYVQTSIIERRHDQLLKKYHELGSHPK